MTEQEPDSVLNPFQSPQVASEAQANEFVFEPGDVVGLRRVRTGLLLVYVGFVVVLLCVILAMALGFLMFGGGELLIFALMGGVGISCLLTFIGPWFCLWAPPTSGSRLFAAATVLLQMLMLLMTGFGYYIEDSSFSLANIIRFAVQVIWGISVVCFVLFMRKMAHYLKRYDLVGRANWLLGICGVFVLAAFGVAIFANAGPAGPAAIAQKLTFMAGLGLVGLVVFVMFANLVNSLLNALRKVLQA